MNGQDIKASDGFTVLGPIETMPDANASVRELIAYLEVENAKLRDRASKLTLQVQALREAVVRTRPPVALASY
jgi:hypothetical protein